MVEEVPWDGLTPSTSSTSLSGVHSVRGGGSLLGIKERASGGGETAPSPLATAQRHVAVLIDNLITYARY